MVVADAMAVLLSCVVFFFQAEDGIRDLTVTGVQTCALPIFDATNILSPVLTVITRIDFDHENFLGHSLREIASEKAGILKPEAPVIVAAQRDRKSTRLNSSHSQISYAVFCLKKKKDEHRNHT